jgi:transcriptional regulator with XRE-family HTH domain
MIPAVRLRKPQAVDDPAQLALFGRRITEARLEAGLTKTELADKLGVQLAEFEQFEAGEADPSKHFDRLAQLTGKPVAWLRADGIEAPTVVAPVTAEATPLLAVDPEPEPEPDPEPEAEAIQEEPTMADELPADETDEPEAPASEPETEPEIPLMTPAPSPAASTAADDFSDDDLTRMLTGLTRQREAIASGRAELEQRAAELDERERMLSERDDHLGVREDAVRDREQSQGDEDASRSAVLDADWHEKLQAFEDTNRQYAAAATALADWARDLRGGEAEHEPEPEAEAEAETMAEEPESPLLAPHRDPDAFPEDDDF